MITLAIFVVFVLLTDIYDRHKMWVEERKLVEVTNRLLEKLVTKLLEIEETLDGEQWKY